jgi:hypothetical protein
MNCLLEAMATVWITAKRQVVAEPVIEEVASAYEGLEQCRRNMQGRERELQVHIDRLTSEAITKKHEGDLSQARARIQERRRCTKRLERLRHGLDLVDSQLDAIKTSELDKEIMLTLKASSNAMRKAGIHLGVQEAENVMAEIDEQMRDAQDVTDVLSNPLVTGVGSAPSVTVDEADLDAELDLLEETGRNQATAGSTTPDQTVSLPPQRANSMIPHDAAWEPRGVSAVQAVV